MSILRSSFVFSCLVLTVFSQEVIFEGPCGAMDRWEDHPTNQPFLKYTIKDGGADPKITITSNAAMSFINKKVDGQQNAYELYKENQFFDPILTAARITVGIDGKKSKDCLVVLRPTNRHPPRFSMPERNSADVEENFNEVKPLITLTATDPDYVRGLDTPLKFSISNNKTGDIEHKFYLKADPPHGDIFEVHLMLKNTLDYETTNLYSLVIEVEDSSESRRNPPPTKTKTAQVTFLINVIDVHDQDPRVTSPCGFTNILENSPIDVEVAKVTALDGDTRMNNKMKYALLANNDDPNRPGRYFKVDEGDGAVKLKISPDRESSDFKDSSTIKFKILITEINSVTGQPEAEFSTTSSECTFNIEDVDDNIPEFNYREYFSKVEEHSKTNVEFKVAEHFIEDIDLGSNAEYTVAIIDSFESTNLFTVSPNAAINKVTFFVQVKGDIDYDGDSPTKSLSFKVKSTGKNNITLNDIVDFHVEIIDINDNAPVFENLGIPEVKVEEHAPENTLVTTLKATDKDSGLFGNAGIIYSLSSPRYDKDFHIDAKSGRVTLKNNHSLDREKMSEVLITVTATDNEGQDGNQRTSEQLTVNILDINDQHPIFRMLSLKTILQENFVDFEADVQVEATDADTDEPNNIVNYVMSATYDKFFEIDSKSGILGLKGALDFEAHDVDYPPFYGEDRVAKRKFEIEVTAWDEGTPALESEKKAKIIVEFTDLNDNVPKFTKGCKEALTINETDKPDEFSSGIHKVEAKDDDISADFNKVYYVTNRKGSDDFVVDRTSGTINIARGSDLSPELKGKLHKVYIEATDNQNTQDEDDWCLVDIHVIDVNNKKPTFTSQPGTDSYSVIEEEQASIEVFKYEAFDVDETADLRFSVDFANSRSEYNRYDLAASQSYDLKKIFAIDPLTGSLTVTKVDRERLLYIDLVVQVEDIKADEGFTPQIVAADRPIRIVIEDINDNDPIFQNLNEEGLYTASIPEHESRTELLKIQAIDVDVDNFISYTLEHTDPRTEPYFKIGKENGVIDMLGVDYDGVDGFHFMEFLVIATDNGTTTRSSNATVNVTIIDINDNDPMFEERNYTITVLEHQSVGTNIITVTATDEDSGKFGLVNYEMFEDQPHNRFFSVSQLEGNITIREELDYEVYPFGMTPIVTAFDDPGSIHSRRKTQTLTVVIIDINDNPPMFQNWIENECTEMQESTVVQWPILQVQATDADQPDTENSRIEYSILEGNEKDYFGIDLNTGHIRLAQSVANKTKKGINETIDAAHKLLIMAQDCGEPRLNSTATYCITIVDENLNKPYFIRPSPDKGRHLITLYEGTGKDEVESIYTVKAEDIDLGENGEVTYRLLNHHELFQVNKDTGKVEVHGELKKHSNPTQYMLDISATDKGDPPHTSENNAELRILVKSQGDERPHFKDKDHGTVLNFTEHSKPKAEIVVIPKADYSAEYHESVPSTPIYYFLKEKDDFDDFDLDSETGNLTIKEGRELDREERAWYKISVHARDYVGGSGNPVPDDKGRDILEILIGLTDINDHPPIFSSRVFTAGISSSLQGGSNSLLFLNATDKDEGINAVINFRILGDITKEDDENLANIGLEPFTVNNRTGELRVNFSPSSNMKGFFRFTVQAYDIDELNDNATVLVYLMRDDQRIVLTIDKKTPEVTREYLAPLVRALGDITKHHCNIDNWKPYGGAIPRFLNYTDVESHFVNRETNKILNPDEAVRLVNQHFSEIKDAIANENIQLIDAKQMSTTQTADSAMTEEHLKYMLMGFSAFLLLCLFFAAAIFLYKIRGLKRNLKAATATAFGSHESGLNRVGLTTAPNTNRHMTEGSNPIFSQEEQIKYPIEDFNESDVGSIYSTESTSSMEFGENPEGRKNPAFIEDYLEEEPALEVPESPQVIESPPAKDPKSTITALKQINSDWRRRATKPDIMEPRKSLANPEILNLFDAPDKRRPSGFVPNTPDKGSTPTSPDSDFHF